MNKLISTLIILGTLFLVASCSSTSKPVIVNQQQFIVISPPSSLFNCPTVDELPDPKTLTNAQVAKLIIELETNNQVCASNMNAIQDYIRFAKANLENRK